MINAICAQKMRGKHDSFLLESSEVKLYEGGRYQLSLKKSYSINGEESGEIVPVITAVSMEFEDLLKVEAKKWDEVK